MKSFTVNNIELNELEFEIESYLLYRFLHKYNLTKLDHFVDLVKVIDLKSIKQTKLIIYLN